jgi:hypothetical protein
MMKKIALLIVIILLTMNCPLYAYIGPGMGGGVVAGVLGVIGAILLALFGILYYPIKRLIKNKKENKT